VRVFTSPWSPEKLVRPLRRVCAGPATKSNGTSGLKVSLQHARGQSRDADRVRLIDGSTDLRVMRSAVQQIVRAIALRAPEFSPKAASESGSRDQEPIPDLLRTCLLPCVSYGGSQRNEEKRDRALPTWGEIIVSSRVVHVEAN
jgi:hypothetical protein